MFASSSVGRSPSPKPPPKPSPGKASLLSRLRSPFTSKIRHLVEFYVQPDDPHRRYSSGDVVTGCVVLKVIRPVRITHISVCLHGYAQVYRNPNSPGDVYKTYGQSLSQGRTNKSGGYFGNGFVSLFESEKILCGEGRLGEGIYQFNFELRFPSNPLPSSIEFERGTISYMITSILTRPTTISPIQTCEHRINFSEAIDIAPLFRPKPRVISLEPVFRKSKGRAMARSKSASTADAKKSNGSADNVPVESLLGDAVPSIASEATSVRESDGPQSPSPSSISFDTCEGSCATSSGDGDIDGSERNDASKAVSKATDHGHRHSRKHPKKPITATIELQKAGYLRGDAITLQLAIKHTKVVKSMNGVIVTLYRQARVDMNPNLPLVPEAKNVSKADEYYPKSRTGLGGLSLSSAGSSHLFRKDISQTFAPLIISPETLEHDIKVSLRVPEEAFPSISCVPGAMISFRYYVEVVLDLQGKLAGLERVLPHRGMISAPYTTPGSSVQRGDGAGGGVLSAWPGHFIDTSQIRRNKNVVSCSFEVVIGTTDSERYYGKNKTDSVQSAQAVGADGYGAWNGEHEGADGHATWNGEEAGYPTEVGAEYYDYYDYPTEGHDDGQSTIHPNSDQYPPPSQPQSATNPGTPIPRPHLPPFDRTSQLPPPRLASAPPSTAFPPPPLPDEQHLSEKDRIRLAETRLLPSAPPADDAPSTSSHAARHAPTAPTFDVLTPSHPHLPPFPHSAAPRDFVASPLPPPDDAVPRYEPHAPDGPSAPPADDKHELQRRQLEMETSAPPLDGGDEEGNTDAERAGPSTETPSAPTLEQIEGSEGLPRYER